MRLVSLVLGLLVASCARKAPDPITTRPPDPILRLAAPVGPPCVDNDACTTPGALCVTARRRSAPGVAMVHREPTCDESRPCAAGGVCSFGRCVPPQCQRDADCPQHHRCVAALCERLACVADQDCGDGYCVNRQCNARPGACESSPPPMP
jgi:hypothetical protein